MLTKLAAAAKSLLISKGLKESSKYEVTYTEHYDQRRVNLLISRLVMIPESSVEACQLR